MSCSTVDFQGSGSQRTGSWSTSCVSKTTCSPSIGTSSRTRRRESLRRAGGPCSGTNFPPDGTKAIAGGPTKDRGMSTQVVLITGGLTGIGRAAAIAFAKKGAKVVVAGRRDEAGKALVKELRSAQLQMSWFWHTVGMSGFRQFIRRCRREPPIEAAKFWRAPRAFWSAALGGVPASICWSGVRPASTEREVGAEIFCVPRDQLLASLKSPVILDTASPTGGLDIFLEEWAISIPQQKCSGRMSPCQRRPLAGRTRFAGNEPYQLW